MNWACPGAVTLLPAEHTGSDRWRELRREGVGSSDIAALMGEGAGDDCPYLVWLDKVGRLGDEDARTGPMEWGLRAEDAAARWFADKTGLELRRKGLLRSRHEPVMQATVDRLSSDGGLGEMKVSETGAAYQYAKQLRRGEIPRHWYWQLVAQLYVTGRSHAWLAAVVGGELYIDRVEYSDVVKDMCRAVDAAHRFWFDHVEEHVMPASPPGFELVDGGLVIDADEDLTQLLEMWAHAKHEGRGWEESTDAMRVHVLEAMGRASVVRVHGRPFVRRRVVEAERVDVTRLRREDPATAARFLTTGAHVRLELI